MKNILFDTHAFLWWTMRPEKIPKSTLKLIETTNSRLFLSIASLWEMQIKTNLGKLDLTTPIPELVSKEQKKNQLEILLIHPEHVYALAKLPMIHKDPFDRILIAQSIVNELLIISNDGQ